MLKFIKRKIRSVLSKISEDQRYYRKLKKLVPELASYKEYQIKSGSDGVFQTESYL